MVKKPLIRNLPSYLVQGTLLWPSFYSSIKVRIFWKGHKVWKNLPLKIWRYSVTSNLKWKIFSNLLAFSEYPNFKKMFLWSQIHAVWSDGQKRPDQWYFQCFVTFWSAGNNIHLKYLPWRKSTVLGSSRASECTSIDGLLGI